MTQWPHQVRAFERLNERWPPKLLIADEVGLGKTIGMLLRQVWLSGRAKRILILAPKAVLGQWQVELREKFNLNWPIYDGRKLVRYPSPALRGNHEREVDRNEWCIEPVVIASSQLMRRRERADALVNEAEPWDLVVLDEAHHARRRAAGARKEGGPNALLALMGKLRARTQGLVLPTATPMQVHPVEVWHLLDLLGLPPEWTADAFLKFFDDLDHPSPSPEALERMGHLFRAVERDFGTASTEATQRVTGLSRLKAAKVLRALRDAASIPRRQMETPERRAALALVRAHTPIRGLVSRHTRELLRRYFKSGMLSTPIAERQVEDRFIDMTPGGWGYAMRRSPISSPSPTPNPRRPNASSPGIRKLTRSAPRHSPRALRRHEPLPPVCTVRTQRSLGISLRSPSGVRHGQEAPPLRVTAEVGSRVRSPRCW